MTLLIVAAMWLLPSALIVAWIKADEWLDARYAAEQPERPEVTPEWVTSLADEPTPLFDQMCFERWETEQ